MVVVDISAAAAVLVAVMLVVGLLVLAAAAAVQVTQPVPTRRILQDLVEQLLIQVIRTG